MDEKLILRTTVSYADVDRDEVMLLPRIFKLLQEGAITHANQFGAGTTSAATRGETWVLNRIAVGIERYPRHAEALRLETWSAGIQGFKGIRDFRVYDRDERVVIAASSLWLYINVTSGAIVRVPQEIVDVFPVCPETAWFSGWEKLRFKPPSTEAMVIPLALRYSDFDANDHVNHTAYLDFVQTALARSGSAIYPQRINVHYGKAIPHGATQVEVRLEPQPPPTRFAITGGDVVFAQGEVEGQVRA